MLQTEKTLRILSVEDPGSDSDDIYQELLKLNQKIIHKKVSKFSELQESLRRHSWNFLIADYHCTSCSPQEILELIKVQANGMPCLLVSDRMTEEDVADMIRAGIEDVVLKSRLGRLLPAVRRILRESEIREKEAKANKIASEAFAAKEQMLAIVSHDIKNPLSAIQLEAQMLLRAVERSPKSLLGEEVKIQSNRILKTTDRLKLLISDLLDKNKSENSLTHITKINNDGPKLIQEVLDALRPLIQQKEITVLKSTPEASGLVSLDRNKMFQVFSNLLNNAIKFTPEKGTIHVSMEESELEFIFSVTDSGPGLTDQELSKVFEKYWTGNEAQCQGTGLGLGSCKTIIEAHGGHIDVENAPGSGARFYFTIPKNLSLLEKASFSYYDSAKDKRKKIYIVDDDEDLREVISWALGKEGYAIHSFHSPKEALDCLIKGRHLPNLIVVDYHMDEVNGSDFLIRKNEIESAQSCPVVMISASPQDAEEEVHKDFYRQILTKPIDLEGLVSNVKKFLH